MKRTHIRPNLTAQLISKTPLDHHPDQHLVFFIHCPDCQTARGFRIAPIVQSLRDGTANAAKVVTYCEQCLRQFEVSVGMASVRLSAAPTFDDKEDCLGVIDKMGARQLN